MNARPTIIAMKIIKIVFISISSKTKSPLLNKTNNGMAIIAKAKKMIVRLLMALSPGVQTKSVVVVVILIILRSCPGVKVALKFWLPVAEVNKSVLVFILRIVKPISNPMKSALASKVALVFVKLLPTDVRLVNVIVKFVVTCSSRVMESTKIVKLDIEEKKVVSVIVNALTEGRAIRTVKIASIDRESFFLISWLSSYPVHCEYY